MIKHASTKGNICKIMHGLRRKKEVNVGYLSASAYPERPTAVENWSIQQSEPDICPAKFREVMTESNGTNSRAWYVVATKPRQEAVAQEHLTRQGYSTLLPTLNFNKRRRGKWQQVTEPTFPGYVFVELEPGSDDMAPIRSTQGCRDLVRFGQQPAAVPEQIMHTLRLSANTQLSPGDGRKDPFSPGDMVAIEEGPFQGLSAIYCMTKGADRVQVLISLLGGDQRLDLDINSVSPK